MGYRPQIPIHSALCSQLNFLNPSPRTNFLGTPLGLGHFKVLFQNSEKRLLASSCLCVRTEQHGSRWTDFHEILHLSIFLKLCLENSSFIEI
jgi:hypothetical protein